MKHFTRKNKIFPLATTQKKPTNQPWNYLPKKNSKKLFKQKSRFFSMEFGRSFSKRILWQIAVSHSFINNPNALSTTKIQQKTWKTIFPGNLDYSQAQISKTLLLDKKFGPYQQSWKAFRTILFGKMWMLYDPSLVPGIAWPVKQKKILLAKMRAFKALSMLVGKPPLKYLTQNLQKCSQISGQTTPILWSITGGLDCFKANVLVKSNFMGTFQAGNHSMSNNNFSVNGISQQKSLGFNYAGDIISYNSTHLSEKSLQNPRYFFGNIFKYGPMKKTSKTTAANALKPFIWLSSFYNTGQVIDFFGQPKQTLKKRRFFYKKPFFQNKSKKIIKQ